MRKISFSVILIFLISRSVSANGVAIMNAVTLSCFSLDSTEVITKVESQISTTITTQYFRNTRQTGLVKYAFPLNQSASAVKLRWKVNGEWFTASIASTPQDTTLPGGGTPHPNLKNYLGQTPLYFQIPQTVILDSVLIVELTYVELLPYAFGKVSYTYPGNYNLIQPAGIPVQKIKFALTSERTIDSINVMSPHPPASIVNTGNSALIEFDLRENSITQPLLIQYTLNANQLGLFSYSAMFADTLVPDSLGRGFLAFIAEPDPGSTVNTIPKVFTLLIDRSGSMSGTKMTQAQNAATFIVNNLNSGDKFNLIDFDDVITSFRPGHILYTPQSRDSAIQYINSLYARNLTNISGVFSVAVPQFHASSDSTANIIIFFTDGMPTYGITSTELLVAHIDQLITSTERHICVFSFGIGSDVNKQLLSLISSHNNGLADFLMNDELYSKLTAFYLTIRNPVLLSSQISFAPPVINQIYPVPLPNLYKGNQMIVVGRYNEAAPVLINLSGKAFGQPVNYSYNIILSDSATDQMFILQKVWAKRKIESLLISYYQLNPNSPQALALKAEIIAISKTYGVITVFTSFSGGGSTGTDEKQTDSDRQPAAFELLGNYPNPFNPSTAITFSVKSDINGAAVIRIYNSLGQLVRVILKAVGAGGIYEVIWDGNSDAGSNMPSGVYFYSIEIGGMIQVGKMNLIR